MLWETRALVVQGPVVGACGRDVWLGPVAVLPFVALQCLALFWLPGLLCVLRVVGFAYLTGFTCRAWFDCYACFACFACLACLVSLLY